MKPIFNVVITIGSLLNKVDQKTVDPDYASAPHGRMRADTEEDILTAGQPGEQAVQLLLTAAAARDLTHGRGALSVLSHLWPGRPVFGTPPEGAFDVHNAFLAAIYCKDFLKTAFRNAWGEAQKRSAQSPTASYRASIVSGTGAGTAVVGGIIGRQELNGTTAGEGARQTLVAVTAGPTNGEDGRRLETRQAVSLGVLEAIDAIAVATYPRQEISIPALGTIDRSPFDEVFIVGDRVVRATTSDELAAAATLIADVVDDRTHEIGKALHASAPRRSQHQFPPVSFQGRSLARILSAPAAFKVTLDRSALTQKAAQRATYAFLLALLTQAQVTGKALADLLLEGPALRLDRLDPQGWKLLPRPVIWKPSAVPPTSEDMKVLDRLTRSMIDSSTKEWESQYRRDLDASVDSAMRAAEGQRQSGSDIRQLAAEYAGASVRLGAHIERVRGEADSERTKARVQFDNVLADPLGRGWKAVILGPMLVTGRCQRAAARHAQAEFRWHRTQAYLSRLESWRRRYQIGTGEATRSMITRVSVEVGERGRYHGRALTHPNDLIHPTPITTCLCMEPDAFDTLYYAASVLQERLPSGVVLLIPDAFTRAAAALGDNVRDALEQGAAGFDGLTAAVEGYFQRLFEQQWEHLYVSAPELRPLLAAALDDALSHFSLVSLVERRSGGSSQTVIIELPEDDPGADELERLLREKHPTDAVYVRSSRTHESAIIGLKLESNLTLEDLISFRGGSPTRQVFLERLKAFHRHDPDATPVFPSRWFEQQVARFDPEVGAIVGRKQGKRDGQEAGELENGNGTMPKRPFNRRRKRDQRRRPGGQVA